MQAVENIVQQFDSITLDEMDHVKLLSRSDTKLAFHDSLLPQFLEKIQPHYRMLEITGMRGIDYESLYFDTPDFLFYNQNHNGQVKRFKVRYRKYMNSGLTFLEVKCKNNKEKTEKSRIQKNEIKLVLGNSSQEFLNGIVDSVESKNLEAKLWIYYTRYTLVSKTRNERLTIDVNMHFNSCHGTANAGQSISDQLVIAEVKQEKLSFDSDFMQLMREEKIHPLRFSKYCMASLSLFEHLKYNRFKPKLLTLKKICNGTKHE
jgi:hypothetical protein